MKERTSLCFGILAASSAMGLLGNALLRAVPWGLNVTLWIAALLLAMVLLARWREVPAAPDTAWLTAAILLFAAGFAWRDSAVLKLLDGLTVALLLSVAAFRSRAGKLHLAAVTEYPMAVLRTFGESTLGAILLLALDVPWKEIPRGGWASRSVAAGRGLLLAFPLLVVFGLLFASADAGFERLAVRAFSWNLEELFLSALVAGVSGWYVCGYLRRLFLAEDTALPAERTAGSRIGVVELTVVLGLLNLLFFSFVLTQAHYFFGGDALVRSAIPLTYAEYARRGFFELVTVAALALPLLLLFHWLQDERTARSRLFPLLAGSLVALLFVIMGSAMMRMRIYTVAYGLTELRLYTTAFMGWLAAVFGWFLLTVLPGRRERFAFGALVLGLATVFGLHLLNPDALIVRSNVAREAYGRFHPAYCASLSRDAVPAMVESLPRLGAPNRSALLEMLSREDLPELAESTCGSPQKRADWRSWSWSRWQAARALSSLPNGPHVGAAPP